MDIIALLCVLFILFNIQYPQRGKLFYDDALRLERTAALRGFAALLIVLGHLALTVGECLTYPVLRQSGLFVVTIFFALSGYGLVLSYKKADCTFPGYWRKRLLTVILPYAVFTVLYVIVRAGIGESVSAKSVLLSFVNGTPTVKYSWFVEVILVLYAAFWIAGRIAKDDVTLLIFGMTVFTVLFVMAMKKLGFESFWYNTAPAFVIGMLWAHKKDEAERALKMHFEVYILGLLIVFACLFYCTRVLWMWDELGEILVTGVFAVLVLVLQYLVPAKSNAVTRFLGDISFELYLSHGAFILLLWPLPFFKANPVVFGLAVYAGSIAAAWLIHKALTAIKKLF